MAVFREGGGREEGKKKIKKEKTIFLVSSLTSLFL